LIELIFKACFGIFKAYLGKVDSKIEEKTNSLYLQSVKPLGELIWLSVEYVVTVVRFLDQILFRSINITSFAKVESDFCFFYNSSFMV
jgi:hypothetical protein